MFQVLAPATPGHPAPVLVFAGRITGVTASWDDTVRGPSVDVVAADFTADLANRDVGDELPEPRGADGRPVQPHHRPVRVPRHRRHRRLRRPTSPCPGRTSTISPPPGCCRMLATTVDAVMWSAVHQTTGAYLKVEDPSGIRASLYQLVMIDGIVQVDADPGEGGAVLSACDVLRDPIYEFEQNVGDIATRAAVSWAGAADHRRPGPTRHRRTHRHRDRRRPGRHLRHATDQRHHPTHDLRGRGIDVANAAHMALALTVRGWRASGVKIVVDDDHIDKAAQMLTPARRRHLAYRGCPSASSPTCPTGPRPAPSCPSTSRAGRTTTTTAAGSWT